MRHFVYQALLLSILVPNLTSSIEQRTTGVESQEDEKSPTEIRYQIPLSEVLGDDGRIKPDLMDGRLPAPRQDTNTKDFTVSGVEGRSPIPEEYYVSDTIIRSKSVGDKTYFIESPDSESVTYDESYNGPAHGVFVSYGGDIPEEDYIPNLDEFFRSKDGANVLGEILNDGPEYRSLDSLVRIEMRSTKNAILEYLTGCGHANTTDSNKIINIVVSSLKRGEYGLYCSYKIVDGVDVYCQECNRGVPQTGEAPLWYSGERAIIIGKKYNIYTIFGQKVINVAGDLMIPYDPQRYDKPSNDEKINKKAILSSECAIM